MIYLDLTSEEAPRGRAGRPPDGAILPASGPVARHAVAGLLDRLVGCDSRAGREALRALLVAELAAVEHE